MNRHGTAPGVCSAFSLRPICALLGVLLLSTALNVQAQSLRVEAQNFMTQYQAAQAAFEANPSPQTQQALEEITEAFAAFRRDNREALRALPPGALQTGTPAQKRSAPALKDAPRVPLPVNQLFEETFDADLGAFTPFAQPDGSADWHFSDSCPANAEPGHSSPGAARWGDPANCFSYDPGSGDTDFLDSPAIGASTCNGGAYISLNYFLDYQESSTFDDAKVLVDFNGGGFAPVADNGDDFGDINNSATWEELFIALDNATGTIALRFEGASADGSFDSGQGFFVDDIVVGCLDFADLALEKTVDDDSPEVGDQVTFTLTLTNLGLGLAKGVQVRDDLPDGVTFVSATVSDTDNDDYDPGDGIWTIGELANGETATLEITVTVTSSLPVTNTALIVFSNLDDPDPSNN
ncbi:MAG: DUF11 domain-containing protein, partial [Rhodothermales bacterium]|nr:DUF11 domain-containing protein [Rhodothermales bacterium]